MIRTGATSLLFSLCLAAAHASPPIVPVDELHAEDRHRRATLVIIHIMDKYHYRGKPLDDELSGQILDAYLENLDGNRSYFPDSDYKDFERYRHQLDDALEEADLEPAFAIFKRYRQRVAERVAGARELLETEFDFSLDEEYRFDRREDDRAQTGADLDELWRKKVKNDYLMLLLADKNEDEIRQILDKRYARLQTSTFQLNANDVFQTFINAYTSAIEPHSYYFTPRSSENFDITMKLSLEGIGAALRAENEYTVVQRIIPGGPAENGGELQTEDRIVGVGQGAQGDITDVVGWRLDDVVDMIRGPKGSVVRLEILSEKADSGNLNKVISITRDKIKLEDQAAKSEVMQLESGGEVGIIRVPAFYSDYAAQVAGEKDYRSTTRDVRRLLTELKQQDLDGLVMDLRGNGGGSLTEALGLTGLFIETGPIIQTRDYSGKIEINSDPDPSISYGGPLAVLVNRNSASGAEIFAGAIQDYRRGIIIGEPTFGKGTVQNVIDLNQFTEAPEEDPEEDHGRLKATIAQFYRISGGSNQYRGVVPDIIFPTARYGRDYGERELDNALPWDKVRPIHFVPASAPVENFTMARMRHEQRIRNNRLVSLLLQDMETSQSMQTRKNISLNVAKRKAERKKTREEAEAIRNELRLAAGLDPILAAGDEPEDTEEPGQPDPFLKETARILYDLVEPVHQTVVLEVRG